MIASGPCRCVAQRFIAGIKATRNQGSPVWTTEADGRPTQPLAAFSRPYGTDTLGAPLGPGVETLGCFHIVPPGHGPQHGRGMYAAGVSPSRFRPAGRLALPFLLVRESFLGPHPMGFPPRGKGFPQPLDRDRNLGPAALAFRRGGRGSRRANPYPARRLSRSFALPPGSMSLVPGSSAACLVYPFFSISRWRNRFLTGAARKERPSPPGEQGRH